jgi:hypothetical protein
MPARPRSASASTGADVTPRSTVAGLAVACLLLVLLTAGCGGNSTLDTSRLEDQVKKTLADRTGFPIKSVSCPSDVKAEKGARFACTVTTDRNERVQVNVIQNDDKGGVTWKLAGPLKR